jgi:hypothetical protein
MIMRVAFHDSSPEPITSERATAFRTWMKGMPGFVDGWHATDPATGRVVTVTIWESEEHMKALRDKVPPGGPVGMKPVQTELFSVVTRF